MRQWNVFCKVFNKYTLHDTHRKNEYENFHIGTNVIILLFVFLHFACTINQFAL